MTMTPADNHMGKPFTRTDTLRSTHNFDQRLSKMGARESNMNEDWSDNNSHTTSTHFRLRMPGMYQPSRTYFNDIASPNLPTSLYKPDAGGTPVSGFFQFNQSVADSNEHVELDLHTLNNSDQHLIFDTKDRRSTFHMLPNLVKTPHKNLNSSGYEHPRNLGGPLMRPDSKGNSLNMSFPRNLDTLQRGNLNNSLSSHSPFGRSSLFQPTQSGPNWTQTVGPKNHPKSRFGSLFGSRLGGSFHNNSNAHFDSNLQKSIFGQTQHKTPNPKSRIANPFTFKRKSPVTPQKGPLRVNSLPNIPSLRSLSTKLLDPRDKKTSIFELKSITERREDENERKMSQHLEDPRESPSNGLRLFSHSSRQKNSGDTSKMGAYEKSGGSNSDLSKGLLIHTKGSFGKYSESGGRSQSGVSGKLGNEVSSTSINQSKGLMKNFRSFDDFSEKDKFENVGESGKAEPEMIFLGKNRENGRTGKEKDGQNEQTKLVNSDSLRLSKMLSNQMKREPIGGNSKSLFQEPSKVTKKKMSIFGGLSKITPKIKKIKNKKTNPKINKTKQLTSTIDNSKIIEQLTKNTEHPETKPQNPLNFDTCGPPQPTSLFNFQTKNASLWDPFATAKETNSRLIDHVDQDPRKKRLKIVLKSKLGHSDRPASPVSQHFLSPNPATQTRPIFGLFNSMQKIRDLTNFSQASDSQNLSESLFVSQLVPNKKTKVTKPYSMTPNLKHNWDFSSFSKIRNPSKKQFFGGKQFAKTNFLGQNPFKMSGNNAPNVNLGNLLKVVQI